MTQDTTPTLKQLCDARNEVIVSLLNNHMYCTAIYEIKELIKEIEGGDQP